MTMMGHNSRSLQSAAEANVETGVWLLCKEFLVTAIQDRRLERGHLRVLACFANLINRHNAKAWPDRATIARMSGMTLGAVSNSLSELRKFGYLISDREPVEQAGNRNLIVYTFGNIDHDTIRSEITKFVEQLRKAEPKDSSPPTVKSASPPKVNFTAEGETQSPPAVKKTAHGEPQTSPPTVASNSRDNNNPSTKKTTGERGTRLSEDWFLPKAWGEWAVQNYEVTPFKVRAEAERFKNYWVAKTAQATKRDWFRTWQNWCSEDRKGWKRRTEVSQHAPDLVSGMTAPKNEALDEWAAARRLTEDVDE
jgi:hypothetical protein